MLIPVFENRFKKDIKRLQKRGKEMKKSFRAAPMQPHRKVKGEIAYSNLVIKSIGY